MYCIRCFCSDTVSEFKVGQRYEKFISTNFRKVCSKGFPGVSADFIKIKVNADVKNLKLDENGYAGIIRKEVGLTEFDEQKVKQKISQISIGNNNQIEIVRAFEIDSQLLISKKC